jgi:hypothetical protein
MFMDLQAAASFGNGYILIDQYQSEILDTIKRGGVLGRRIRNVPATGSPSRYFEQTAIGAAAFDNKSSLAPTATSPTRGEKAVSIKAITNRVQFGLFDQQIAGHMPQNLQLKAKDLADMIAGIQLLHDTALWTGTDVVNGALTGDGTTNQYVGLPRQISTTTAVIASGSNIVDAIRLEVAKLVGSATDNLMPTAIYMNPLAKFALESEMKANSNNTVAQVEVVAGVKCDAIMTAAGLLPVIVDPLLAANPAWASAAPAGQTNYPFVIVTESLIEYHYVGSETTQLFQLGTTSNLQDDYVAVKFGAPVVKAGNRAHVKGVIQKTTY